MNTPDTHPNQRIKADRQELVDRIAQALPRDGTIEPQPGVHFYRESNPIGRLCGSCEPALCVIAQGAKKITLGVETFRYDPAHYLISTMALPVAAEIVDATPRHPYLSFRLVLDPAIVTSVMMQAGLGTTDRRGGVKALDVSPLDAALLDTVLRLVRLIDTPDEYHVLAPLIVRELVYRLLTGAQGDRMRHLTTPGGQAHRMARAVDKIRNEFDRPLRIEAIARELRMSVSGFHAHFKAVTAMSPLQFQKQLRLQEARRLMLSENLDAAEAGYRVGYDDASHFSRQYKQQFGDPPMRDIERLREMVGAD